MIKQLFCATCLLASSALAADPGFSLTVYSTADPATFDPKAYAQQLTLNPHYRQQVVMPGYGIVREIRPIELKEGLNTLRFTDVASGIDPTTVRFLSLTDTAGTGVIEQSYEYDLLNSQKLLEKYLDKQVVIERTLPDGRVETITGQLLSSAAGLVVRTDDGQVRILNGYSGIQLADAANLITKPTLVWQISAKQPGRHDVQVTYQTDGITWRSDYNLVLSADDRQADIGAWVTILNQSGASYPDATLKLVAGDVQRIQPPQYGYADKGAMGLRERQAAQAPGFVEKSFFEYHLYTLGRPTSIPANSTKQIELFDARSGVPVNKTFVYYGLPPQYRLWMPQSPYADRNLGTEMNKKVDIYLLLDNKEANGLGIPLPAGRVRVFKRDEADNNLEFIGEDVIQHTPKDEQLMIRLGSAFDIVGERKQTDFQVNTGEKWIVESFEIKLRNHKTEPVTVIVKENLYRWVNWAITRSSDPWEKHDARTIHIPVEVKPDEEQTITYTVRYTW